MRKVILSMFQSVDGYIAGPDGEFIGPEWSGDLERHWSGWALERAGHLLYGRTNFVFNKAFWEPAATDPSSPAASIPHAAAMNRLPKTVFSRTLTGNPGWNGTIAGDDLARTVARLRAEGEGDILMFGGAGIANAFVRLDLFDEYRLMVIPTLFGAGTRLFEPGFERKNLKLVGSKTLDTGAVIVHYERRR
jgi:dihydrofolate reductase